MRFRRRSNSSKRCQTRCKRAAPGYLTVNNDPVLWATVNAVKELNDKLETDNAELKARDEALEKRLERLEKVVNERR